MVMEEQPLLFNNIHLDEFDFVSLTNIINTACNGYFDKRRNISDRSA